MITIIGLPRCASSSHGYRRRAPSLSSDDRRSDTRSQRSGAKRTCLQVENSCAYTLGVAETAATRIGVRHSTRRTTASERYFYVRTPCAFNGRALVGERSRSPVAVYTGTPIPPCARPPQLELGAGFFEPVHGGRIMRQAPARPEQIRSLIGIVSHRLANAPFASGLLTFSRSCYVCHSDTV